MTFWQMLLYPDISNFLMFYPSELGSKDLSDYKNSKAYSYYKSGWQYKSIKDPFHKLWIILEKTAKIRTCYCTFMASMGEICNHVAAAMYHVEAAVWIGLTNSACASNVNPMSGCQIEKVLNQKK